MEDTEKIQLEEMLTCTVCQDIFTDPRQLPCGHSMCMHCLENMRDHSSDLPFRCPDCRSFFGPIIKVQKSYNLANIAENFRETRRSKEEQTKNVYCDCCPEKKILAIKMCLKCEVSMCKEHIKDHQELPVFTGHPLVRPLGDHQERKCPQHNDEVLRYYCNSSRRYLCNMCALEKKQQNHESEASTVLRRQLTEYMDQRFTTLKEQIRESTKSVKRLKEDIQLNVSHVDLKGIVQDFGKFVYCHNAYSHRDLRGRDVSCSANTMEVNGTRSPVPQNYLKKLNVNSSGLSSVSVVLLCLWFIVLYYAYNYSVENQMLTEALDKQQNRVHQIYSTIAELLAERPSKIRTPPETEGILMLDVDTASPFLGFSADFKTVERVKTKLDYPSSMKRFAEAPQVLSALCFSSGTHIWEVEAEGYWDIAISYKSIQRKSKHSSAFGKNDNSWSLTHNSKGKLCAYHDGGKTILPGTLQSSRISVMVDFEKGNITFSAVEESTITKLHEFKAKLTQPVCLGVGLYRVDPPSKASILSLSAS